MGYTLYMLQATLRCLEVFVCAAETGSFSAASERLDIAQPSVSAHIAALERAVGGEVFRRRRGSRPVLTDLGNSVLSHAREMLNAAQDMHAHVLNLHAIGDQSVVFSCQRSLANFTLNRSLTSFALAHPNIQLVVRIGKHEDVMSDMREGRSDLGCLLTNEEERGHGSISIGRQALVFVASPNHPLVVRRRIKPAEIASESFVGPPPESLFGRTVNGLLAKVGISGLRTVAQATEYQFLRELISANVGISLSGETSIQADVAAGRLAKLDVDVEGLYLDIRLLTSRTRPQTPAVALLTEHLGNEVRSSFPQG